MLLGFKLYQLVDIVLIKGRQFHEAGENRLTRHRVADLLLLHLQRRGQLLDRQGNLGKAGHFLRGIREDTLRSIGFQNQSATLGGIKDRHRNTL